jgi:hypothetical protein
MSAARGARCIWRERAVRVIAALRSCRGHEEENGRLYRLAKAHSRERHASRRRRVRRNRICSGKDRVHMKSERCNSDAYRGRGTGKTENWRDSSEETVNSTYRSSTTRQETGLLKPQGPQRSLQVLERRRWIVRAQLRCRTAAMARLSFGLGREIARDVSKGRHPSAPSAGVPSGA